MKNVLLFTFLLSSVIPGAQSLTTSQYKEDFNFFWNTIQSNYAYLNKKQTDWQNVKAVYNSAFDTVTSRRSFVLLLEKVFHELYDHHASLNVNTRQSQRLVPSGTDIWAEYINGKPIITELRKDFGAEKAGIRAGMEVVAVNDIPVEDAIQAFYPTRLRKEDMEAKNYALRLLLAGNHTDARKIRTRQGKEEQDYYPDAVSDFLKNYPYSDAVEGKILQKNIGYIRINNRLGDNGIIPLFDSVLNKLMYTKALIIDLRETPSGGNTTVARSIMGRFISKESPYQKHALPAEEKAFGIKRSWVEFVSPKKPTYTKPLVVLCNHWTGSVGEGITIGFDGLKRAAIIGTRMAGLKGAIYSYTLPHTGIGFSFPVESLFHVNGTPRENFVPPIQVDLKKSKSGEDVILSEGLMYFNKK